MNLIRNEVIHSGITEIGRLIEKDIFTLRDLNGRPHPFAYLRRLAKTRYTCKTVYPK